MSVSTSLLEVLDLCVDNNVNLIPDLPFKKEILNNTFNPQDYKLEELITSLHTYSYLNLDSKQVVEQILWIVGENMDLFYQYFERNKEISKTYNIRENVSPILKNELKRFCKFPCSKEKLLVRCLGNPNDESLMEAGNMKLLEWYNKKGYQWNTDSCASAAKYNQFEILKWLKDNKCPWDNFTCLNAAKCGNFEMLKWCVENGCEIDYDFVGSAAIDNKHMDIYKWCKIDYIRYNVLNSAAKNGFLEILKLAAEDYNINASLINESVSFGHIGILKWFVNEDGGELDAYTFMYAVENKQYEIIEFLKEKKCPVNNAVYTSAVETNNFELLRWLMDKQKIKDSRLTLAAVEKGYFDILKWLVNNDCNIDYRACSSAAQKGYFDILKWLVDDKCIHLDKHAYECAAENGHFEILKWCVEKYCNWNIKTIDCAAKNGQYEILDWLIKNGCPKDKFIKSFSNINILKLLHSNGGTLCAKTFENAVINDDFESVKWLYENKCPWDNTIYTIAINNEYFDILKWMMNKLCSADKCISSGLARKGHIDLLKWCVENGYNWNKGDILNVVKHNKEIYEWLKITVCSEYLPS